MDSVGGAGRAGGRGGVGATPPLLRRLNARLVLDTLRAADTMSVAELAAGTALSRPTVDAAVGDLSRLGLVCPADGGGQRRGRPARRFRFRAEAAYVLGLDIRVEQVHVVLSDLDGTVVAEDIHPVAPDALRADRLRAVRTAADTALSGTGLSYVDFRCAGVATPGIVDAAQGRVRSCQTIPEWSDFDLAGELRRLLGCHVLVDNDANLGAIGECWRGVARGVASVVFFLAGKRFGAGLVLDQRLVRGHGGGAGELGFLRSREGGDTRNVIATVSLLLNPELIVVGYESTTTGESPADILDDLRRQLAQTKIVTPPRLELSTLGTGVVALGAVRHALDAVDAALLDSVGDGL
ncbi:ROK family protein [Flindersiella endophytica]